MTLEYLELMEEAKEAKEVKSGEVKSEKFATARKEFQVEHPGL